MESSFQFTNPVLVELEFGLNDKFEIKDNKKVNTNIHMSVTVQRYNEEKRAGVKLKVEIGGKDEDAPFYITAVEEAKFRWDDSLQEDIVNRLLNQNAPSLLLSYIRPIIVQITSASSFEAYNIPFIDFTKNNQ